MTDNTPLYLGFDLSTQQLKAVAVTSDLKVAANAVFDFDRDAQGFDIKKGVMTNEAEHEVFAPVAMWLQAIDSVLAQLKTTGVDLGRIKGVSGAGMQHGSVYWNQNATQRLNELDDKKILQDQLVDAFAYPYSPNWQDASTQAQCDLFDQALGDEETLARITGSKAHHRFTGPQILRFRSKHPDAYTKTSRISLVSSFLASVFLGNVAPIDISDACGMNLWDIKAGKYHDGLLALTAGNDPSQISDLRAKLGDVPESGGDAFGKVSNYFVRRYGFNPECDIFSFSGDNPSTILALPLRPLDAIVSLGTSTTFLMSTPYYKTDPSVHLMNHPTTPGLYMFMLCYKNGGLAREQVRDSLHPPSDPSNDAWSQFNHQATTHPPLNAASPSSPLKLALYFPRPEIVPNVSAGIYRYLYTPSPHSSNPSPLSPSQAPLYPGWDLPNDDARAILESQLLSLRLRSRNIVAPPDPNPDDLPAQPRRIYLVGGGSYNPAIAKLAGEVLGGVEGVYRLDVGGNACALGSAYKAAWACERTPKEETFEAYVAQRWREEDFAQKVSDGYDADVWRRYEDGVQGLRMVEMDVLAREWRGEEEGGGRGKEKEEEEVGKEGEKEEGKQKEGVGRV